MEYLLVRIRERLITAQDLIAGHPLLKKAKTAGLNDDQRKRYTIAQVGMAMVWPGFLGTLKDLAENPRFKQALGDNSLCEVGAHDVAHVTLAIQFALSQNMTIGEIGAWTQTEFNQQSVASMLALLRESEAIRAGYMLGNEALAATMFESLLPAFAVVSGCDTRYMSTHVQVDRDEHVRDIAEAISELLFMGDDEDAVLVGLERAIQARVAYLTYIETGRLPIISHQHGPDCCQDNCPDMIGL